MVRVPLVELYNRFERELERRAAREDLAKEAAESWPDFLELFRSRC